MTGSWKSGSSIVNLGTLGINYSMYLPSRCYAISLCIDSFSPQKKSDKGSFSDFFLREGVCVCGGGSVCRLKPAVVAVILAVGDTF